MKFYPPLLLASSLSLQPIAAELTPLQTIPFEFTEDGTFTDFPSGEIYLNAYLPLDSFTKFNPSLGTLTEVLLTIQVSGSFDITLTSDDLISPEASFALALDNHPDDYAEAVIIYSPSGGPFGISVASDWIEIPSIFETDLEPTDYGAPEGFYFDYSEGSLFGGYSDGEEILTEGSLLVTDPEFEPSDFIGTGNVTGLDFNAIASFGSGAYSENLNSAFIEANIYFEPGQATLQYVYTPAEPSETPPVITNYSRSGSIHTIQFTGEAGKLDWIVRGGTDFMTFSVNHSSTTTFTETSPGVYSAEVDLSDLESNKYFLRIE